MSQRTGMGLGDIDVEEKIKAIPGMYDYLMNYVQDNPTGALNFDIPGKYKKYKKNPLVPGSDAFNFFNMLNKFPDLSDRVRGVFQTAPDGGGTQPPAVPALVAGLSYPEQREAILAQAANAMATIPDVKVSLTTDLSDTGKKKKKK